MCHACIEQLPSTYLNCNTLTPREEPVLPDGSGFIHWLEVNSLIARARKM